MRESYSSDDDQVIKSNYNFEQEIIFSGTNHKLPFGKIRMFEKYLFLISHYFWAKKYQKIKGMINIFTLQDQIDLLFYVEIWS